MSELSILQIRNYGYSKDAEDESATLPKNQQKLRLNMGVLAEGARQLLSSRGFVGSDDDINALQTFEAEVWSRRQCQDGEIIIQGDHRQRLVKILKDEGYTQTK